MNVSNQRLYELTKAEAELKLLREDAAIGQFVEELKENIGVMLAVTPMESWSARERAAFLAAEGKHPYGAMIYKTERLPRHKY